MMSAKWLLGKPEGALLEGKGDYTDWIIKCTEIKGIEYKKE